MSDDPFAEPSDSDRTIIRPRVSGVRGSAGRVASAPAATPGAAPFPAAHLGYTSGAATVQAGDRVIRPVPKIGINPLVAAASPVLAAIVRINSDRRRAPDVENLRRAMVTAMRRFETDALATGMDTRSLRAARYALCATVDDLVLSTPWGSSSTWARQSMTSIFHNEVTGGERFFQLLGDMQQDLGRHLAVVELMYLCLSLGFSGQYRVLPRGGAALTELRDAVYRTIRQRRGEFERELSPQWRGIDAGARPLSRRVPIWALGLATLAIAAVAYIVFSFELAGVSDVAFAELFGLPPHGPVTVPRTAGAIVAASPAVTAVATPPAETAVTTPPAETAVTTPPAGTAVTTPLAETAVTTPPAETRPALSGTYVKLREYLDPEIRAGVVQMQQDAQVVMVRLANRSMFGSGAATLAPSYTPLLNRIGEALNDETGRVLVYGFTDDRPIRTARFPSNFELSQARAEAVAALLRPKLKDPGRLGVQGEGEKYPITSNATAEGRQQNRRTEIVLVRGSDAM